MSGYERRSNVSRMWHSRHSSGESEDSGASSDAPFVPGSAPRGASHEDMTLRPVLIAPHSPSEDPLYLPEGPESSQNLYPEVSFSIGLYETCLSDLMLIRKTRERPQTAIRTRALSILHLTMATLLAIPNLSVALREVQTTTALKRIFTHQETSSPLNPRWSPALYPLRMPGHFHRPLVPHNLRAMIAVTTLPAHSRMSPRGAESRYPHFPMRVHIYGVSCGTLRALKLVSRRCRTLCLERNHLSLTRF
jgi:hypothetical protein